MIDRLKRVAWFWESGPARMDRYLATLAARPEGKGDYSLAAYARTRSVFVHIPKTAGVSVVHALYGNLGAGHLAMRDYERALGAQELGARFKFAFVRNPWDRLYSAYSFLRGGGMNKHDRVWSERVLGRYEDFEDFVMRGLNTVGDQVHFIPQVDFLTNPSGIALDFLGFYENIDDDFEIARAVVNPDAVLMRRNPTVRTSGGYRDVYSPPMIDRVADVYRGDVETFGYEFDGSNLAKQLGKRPSVRPDVTAGADRIAAPQ